MGANPKRQCVHAGPSKRAVCKQYDMNWLIYRPFFSFFFSCGCKVGVLFHLLLSVVCYKIIRSGAERGWGYFENAMDCCTLCVPRSLA